MRWARVVLLGIVTLFFRGVSPAVNAATLRSESRSLVVHDIQLSLTLPQTIYPRNALVRVTVEARNVSKQQRLIYGTCAGALSVYIVDRKGNATYSSAGDFESRCEGVNIVTLPPGGTIRNRVNVVLRSAGVRAVVNLNGRTVLGPVTRVRLTPANGPRIVIRQAPYLHAEVRAPGTGRVRKLLYMESSACPSGSPRGALAGGGTLGWSSTPPYKSGAYWFSPGCDHPVRWRLIAGFVGESVVEVNRYS